MKKILFLSALFYAAFLLFAIAACSPGPGQTVTEPPAQDESKGTVAETEPQDTIPAGCETFESARRGQQALDHYVIYRGFLREGDFEEAFENWKIVYDIAPAADGQRWTVFNDGVYFYETLLREEEDPELRDNYIRKILGFYDQIGLCYPEQKANARARKAFDLYYYYRDYASLQEIFELFAETIEYFGEETPAFVVNPFTALLVSKTFNKNIDLERAREYAQFISELVKANVDGDDEAWNRVGNFTPQRLMDLERIRGFYDCQYYIDTYYELYSENPEDCEAIQMALGKMQWGECPEDLDVVVELQEAASVHCVVPEDASSLVRQAYAALREADFQEAINFFERAIDEEEDADKKANYALIIGKIYYSHLRDFPRSREFAQRAGSYRPNWGEPHILIGKLYASSGPLCGPGTGWDSQVVTWVAIDEWERARSKDPESRSEANQLINSYRQYMPSIEDIFQRGLSEGDSYFVECWIQRETTIRRAGS